MKFCFMYMFLNSWNSQLPSILNQLKLCLSFKADLEHFFLNWTRITLSGQVPGFFQKMQNDFV